MDESEIIRRVQQGDMEAFGELVREHQASLRAFVARYVPNSSDVQDIVQDALVNAFVHIQDFDLNRQFGPWARGICKNRVCNYYRARSRREKAAVALVDNAIAEWLEEQSEDVPDDSLKLTALATCLDKLKGTHRQMMELRYEKDIPIRDMAARLGRSATSITQILFRIREALRECVRKEIRGSVS